jgi:hypothetical protein
LDSGINFDEQAFNASATQGCLGALSSLTRVVNPSGLAACFNIPFLDNATGVFEADIRLYQVTPPKNEFSKITPTDYMLQVQIPQASLSDPRPFTSNHLGDTAQGGSGMKMLQEFQHVGQIHSGLMVSMLSV